MAMPIAVDSAGNAYVTGIASTDFPTTFVACRSTDNGGNDAFITKLNPAGSALVYSTFFGSSSGDQGFAIAASDAGRAYVYGSDPAGAFVAALQMGAAVEPPATATATVVVTTTVQPTPDTTAPAAVSDLAATSGAAALYLRRLSDAALTESNWAAGSRQSMTVTGLTPGETYHFALKAQDEVPNLSPISNSAEAVAALENLYLVYVPESFRGR